MANEVKWIKIVVDIFSDDKILMIESLPDADSIIVIWFKLLCLAGKSNNSGIFVFHGNIPYTEEMLCAIFRRPLNTIRLALRTFEEYGMIETIEGVITIPNWDKHQNESALSEIREYKRLAKREEREKKKAIIEEESDLSATCRRQVAISSLSNSPILVSNSSKVPSTKGKNFTPPTVEEVSAYCQERGNNIDAETFCDFYQSKDWVIGKDKMKNWQAAVRTWEKREQSKPTYQKKEPFNMISALQQMYNDEEAKKQ